MKRTFIAVDVVAETDLMEAYKQIQHALRLEKINWADAGNLHITLKFLGDTGDEDIKLMQTKIKEIVYNQKRFKFTLKGLGIFKNIHDPRILWIGCNDCKEMIQLQAMLEKDIAEVGFKSDNKSFNPHLTIGRIKMIREINQLTQLITQFKDTVFQTQYTKEIIYYESILTSGGARYFPICNFTLL